MIEEGYETYRQMMLKKPYADPSAMKILTAMVAEANPKARNIDLASLVDSSFVEQLEREGMSLWKRTDLMPERLIADLLAGARSLGAKFLRQR